MSHDYEEKRDFYRMRADTPVAILVVDTQEKLHGRCQNLSAAGVMINIDRSLPIGSILDINITPEYSVVNPFDATIEVVRIEENADSSYTIGGTIRSIG